MYLQTDLGRIFYQKDGQLSSTNGIVFLHGFGGDASVWDDFKDLAVKNKFRFLSLDLPGHGFSFRPPKPLKMKEIAVIVKKVLENEGIKEVIVVGHCFGGMVGLEMALNFPDLVKKLILICSSCQFPYTLRFFSPLLSLLAFIPWGYQQGHVDMAQFRGTADFDPLRIYSDLIHVGLGSYLKIYQGILNWSRKEDLNKLRIPTLIIAGRYDHIFCLEWQKKMAKMIKEVELYEIDSNHIAPINKPEELKRILAEAISGKGDGI
ncbi:hypothetical protein A2160_04365 [Candidatus Beckwithbacteria bacterium RBG_13_42_9]|uniref:AB hydrolase-1 domain-containing protein n=1 Tax=Candidatus Beckwithbacteria bacterium RBG_13_42_9 TaxID=1797457 RepID=A0A1F5E6D1_9BACT|nr:MAG: hypothetical protein A2160_04365 [Candidatus Beckwithbacteria bacterium RBG_13_42_9]